MIKRPLVGILHLIVYLGFIVINIELIEIIIDGILGTHRVFSSYLGVFYNILIGIFEIFGIPFLICSQKSQMFLLSCHDRTFQRAVDSALLFNFLIFH